MKFHTGISRGSTRPSGALSLQSGDQHSPPHTHMMFRVCFKGVRMLEGILRLQCRSQNARLKYCSFFWSTRELTVLEVLNLDIRFRKQCQKGKALSFRALKLSNFRLHPEHSALLDRSAELIVTILVPSHHMWLPSTGRARYIASGQLIVDRTNHKLPASSCQ